MPKAYRVRLRRPPADADLRRLAEGVELEDGPTAPAEVRRLGEREIEIVLREGRNRQVRRMAEAIGNRVVALRRVRFGPIELGDLAEGEARRLSDEEIAALRDAGARGRSRAIRTSAAGAERDLLPGPGSRVGGSERRRPLVGVRVGVVVERLCS